MAISELPTVPLRSMSAEDFESAAQAFLGALPTFRTEANALGVEISDDAEAAALSATNASASQAVCQTFANVPKWVSGTTYTIGDLTWSPSNQQTYRRRTTGAGTTDPSSDATSWRAITPNMAMPRIIITTTDTLDYSDTGHYIRLSGSFTLSFSGASTLGTNWTAILHNVGSSTVTLDPYSTQTINGAATYSLIAGAAVLVQCNGTDLRALELYTPPLTDYQEFLTSGSWSMPTGASWVYVEAVGGGGGGANVTLSSGSSCGGGGGGFNSKLFRASELTATVTVTVGGGGNGGASGSNASGYDGTASTFGSYLSAAPGRCGSNTVGGAGGCSSPTNVLGEKAAYGYASGSGAYYNKTPGGNSVMGGAGGGGVSGATLSAGGVSTQSGNGGDGNATSATKAGNGSVPGGGGGGSSYDGGGGDGAAGRVRVWSW